MTTYTITTQSSLNEMLLHSLMQTSFITTSLDEAKKVFNAEVEELAKCYKTAGQLPYSITDQESQYGIYCTITALSDDEDADVEFIENSEYFYEYI